MTHHVRNLLMLFLLFAAGCAAAPAIDTPPREPAEIRDIARNYPKIVLYSVAWCPHCRAAKEYFTSNNIPFINRDVESDAAAMRELTGKYQSNGVPVIVIGDDTKVLKGFSREEFEKALREVQEKK